MMIIAIIAVVLLSGIVIGIYNTLVRKRNKNREALAAIDVYLQNRFDALTQIAETVVAYAKHEKDTLNELTRVRQNISALPASMEKIEQLQQVEEGLQKINIQAEAYPELKANENYLQLQRTINELEERLSASRRTYNANVTDYNTYIASVPNNIFANMFGFREENLLAIEDAKKSEVNLNQLLRG